METLKDFRRAVQNKRCGILSMGFCFWMTMPGHTHCPAVCVTKKLGSEEIGTLSVGNVQSSTL